jgi:hypothetical protein
MELVFTKDKETPKKVRFSLDAEDGGAVSGSLYVTKDEADKIAKDDKIVVTIKGLK